MKKESTIQISLHSVKNILGNFDQPSFFSDKDLDIIEKSGFKNLEGINKYGIDLTEFQSRVLEGILKGFSETSYKGNLEPKSVSEELKKSEKNNVPVIYKNINSIPRLRATQKQILDWSGISSTGPSVKIRAIETLKFLGEKQYCFFYERTAEDLEGNLIKNKNGTWKKEDVVCVGTLFNIKVISAKKEGRISYYEISPSPIFLDQIEKYYLVLPNNWREEVRELFGYKKASSYTFTFLLFLRYQFEIRRRSKKMQPPYIIIRTPEEIGAAINIPPSVIQKKPKRLNEILEMAYEVAKKLNYLSDVNRQDHVDHLTLNEERFAFSESRKTIKNAEEIDSVNTFSENDIELFNFFHEERKKYDLAHVVPTGIGKTSQLVVFKNLQKSRSLEDVKKVVSWSFRESFWCSRLSTPKKLSENFSNAWVEMHASRKDNKDLRKIENENLAKEMISRVKDNPKGVSVLMTDEHVEFSISGNMKNFFVNFDNKHFPEILESTFKKYAISFLDSSEVQKSLLQENELMIREKIQRISENPKNIQFTIYPNNIFAYAKDKSYSFDLNDAAFPEKIDKLFNHFGILLSYRQ